MAEKSAQEPLSLKVLQIHTMSKRWLVVEGMEKINNKILWPVLDIPVEIWCLIFNIIMFDQVLDDNSGWNLGRKEEFPDQRAAIKALSTRYDFKFEYRWRIVSKKWRQTMDLHCILVWWPTFDEKNEDHPLRIDSEKWKKCEEESYCSGDDE